MVYNQQLARYAVPFLGKYAAMTMLPSRSRTGAKTSRSQSMTITKTRRKKQYVRKSFKNMLYDNLAAKHCNGNQGRLMTHNTIYTLVPTALPVQGDGNSNRDGDAIDIVALKLKGFAQTHSNASAYSYRILVGWTGEELSSLGSNFGSGLGTSEIFLPNTTDNWVLNGVVNPKAFTCVYDQTLDIGSQITGVVDLTSFQINLPFQTRFLYQSAGSVQGKSRNLCVVIIAATAGGTAGTTNAGSIYW